MNAIATYKITLDIYEESMNKKQKLSLSRNNILCICGHPWSEHGWSRYPFVPMKWNECYGVNEDYDCIDDRAIDCSCDDYRQDNLEYLRQKHEGK